MTALTPISDTYAQRSTEVSSQARGAFTVSKSDSADLSPLAKALYIGVTGDVTILPINATDTSQTVLFKAHPVGYMPVQARRVMSTGTTATNIVALTDAT